MFLELDFSGGLFYAKNDVLKLFDLMAPMADFIHGLEPQGSLGSKSCIKAKVLRI